MERRFEGFSTLAHQMNQRHGITIAHFVLLLIGLFNSKDCDTSSCRRDEQKSSTLAVLEGRLRRYHAAF